MSNSRISLSPVKKIFVTQVFGVNKASYIKFGLQGHNGIDFRAFLPNGERCYEGGKSEVFSPHDGKCLENVFDAKGYGWYVKIESDTQGSVLAHFSSQSPIKVGETVKSGQFIGFQGTTGNSTGIHLHWGWYPIPRNRMNGFNGYENQEGKYKPYQGVSMSEKMTVEKADWDKLLQNSLTLDDTTDFLGLPRNSRADAVIGAIQKIIDERTSYQMRLNKEIQEHKETAVKLDECQKTGSGIKIEPEVTIAGKVWEINGLQVTSNGVTTGNYRIK